MSKINIPPIKDGFNLSKINDAFATVVDHLNNKVFYRNVPEGEPNMLSNDLDMNGNRVYNLPEPVADHEPVRKKDIPNAQNLHKSLRVEDTQIPAFPDSIIRRNKLMSFDDQGNPQVQFPSADSATQLRIDLAADSGSSLVTYRGSSSDFITKTVQDKLEELYNVLDFGADPTGVTDSSSAFIKAGMYSKHIEIPAGNYLINTPISFVGSGYILKGAGNTSEGTCIINGSPNSPAIVIGDGVDRYYGCAVSGIQFSQSDTVTAVPGNMGLLVLKQGQTTYNDISISKYPGQLYSGLVFDDVSQAYLNNFHVQDCAETGIVLRSCNDIYGTNLRSDANMVDGFQITDTRGLYFTNATAYFNGRYAWNLNTGGSNSNYNHFYVNCIGDSSGSNNWQITQLTESSLSNCWGATQKDIGINTFASGFYLDGTEVRDITFDTCQALYNNANGVHVERASRIKFSTLQAGNTLHGNGRAGSAAGVYVGPQASYITFSNSTAAFNVGYGYNINPSATFVKVKGGEITGNSVGPFSPGSVQTNCIVRGVDNWNPRMGLVTTPAVPPSGSVVTNTTGTDCYVYILTGAVQAVYLDGIFTYNETGINLFLPAGSTIQMDYTVAPLWKWMGV